MKVTVKFFAALREVIGKPEIEQELPPGATVQDLLNLLTQEHPVLSRYVSHINVAVNRKYVDLQTTLQQGDEVACLPPVGGG
jgi:MoaD family protein